MMKNDGNLMKTYDGTKIYLPKNIKPAFENNVIVDNYTAKNGNVYNRSDKNIELSKIWVDENHK